MSKEIFSRIGFGKKVEIDKTQKKKVLITGSNSYIGTSFEQYAKKNYSDNFVIDTIDMRDDSWKEYDFSKYDTVFHVAGIAHADVGNVSEETKKKYYSVNTDLAIETAKKAKESKVKQFVYMSSIIIYGESEPYGKQKIITKETEPNPANFYGDSKWQADIGVRKLADKNFNVLVLRPPMIYGKGSKGNYPALAKLARKLPIFPNIKNERSMLYIENLCEFLCQVMLVGEGGIFFPQNKEYTNTVKMVDDIRQTIGKNTIKLRILNPFVKLGTLIPGKIRGLINKAFGNLTIDQELSEYDGLDYRNVDLKESIKRTEEKNVIKKVLFLVNHDVVIYNFRLELVERLLEEGYEVHISSPYGERIDDLVKLGSIFHEIKLDRHGKNPLNELKLIKEYKKLYKTVNPDIILGYTIKPNIYGAYVAKKRNIPFVANITGLGTALENPGMSQKILVVMYKIAFRKIKKVYFQNEENRQFFIDHKIALGKHDLLPGSGVNLKRFHVQEYPKDDIIKFVFVSRIMKEKGIEQYLETAKKIKEKYPNTEFHICGFCEAEYEGKLNEYNDKKIVIYHGMVRDISGVLKDMHCLIHPSYYPEGMSNVLLEACASGRPVITTNRSGCREIVDDNKTGYIIEIKNTEQLIEKVEEFIKIPYEQKVQMGLDARKKVEKEFDRNIVVNKYLKDIEEINV